jgi:hypothetical protein
MKVGPGPAAEYPSGQKIASIPEDIIPENITICTRISEHLVGLCDLADNEMDSARTRQDRVDANLRIFGRTMSDLTPAALAVQHACRMYLRAYEAWNVGEAAMGEGHRGTMRYYPSKSIR